MTTTSVALNSKYWESGYTAVPVARGRGHLLYAIVGLVPDAGSALYGPST